MTPVMAGETTGEVVETYAVNGRAADVLIGDDEYPVFNELLLTQKAQNSWGTV